jgi:hypothetical protein
LSAGYELQSALKNWESALKNVPDAQLSRAYEHATENWNWQDKSHPFTEDAIAQAYTLLLVEDRQRDEAEKRNAVKRSPDTYRCHHCADIGYQLVFTLRMQRWYSSQRPCVCEAAPTGERSKTPLAEPEFIRSKLGEWARRTDVDKFGPPSESFKQFTVVK